ncbi:MAG: phosphoglycerate kinase [Dehalococcoidia bacterium]|nr:phosphoglycerate kinase [Dehalococcoidia bacterium]
MVPKTVRDIQVAGKRVLVRVDFNVPMQNGRVTSLTRLRASVPTIRYLLDHDARVIVCSHLGRPGGKVVESMRLEPVCKEFAKLLGAPVGCLADCVGAEVEATVATLKPGHALLLENVRFHPGDEKNDPEFSQALASLADLFVQDAFGVVHRTHASTVGVTAYLPAVAGLLLEKELTMMARVLDHPQRPLIAIMGGAKVGDKMAALENLLTKVDAVLIGGGMVAAFLAAQGHETGATKVADGAVAFAAAAMQRSHSSGVRLVLPSDLVVAQAFDKDAPARTVRADQVPPGWFIVDIGPATLDVLRQEVFAAKTVFWNGTMGVFEWPAFSRGTRALADILAKAKGTTTIVGGGSTAEVIESLGLEDKIPNVSTGGGATLEYLAGQTLPGIAALATQPVYPV